MINSSKAKLLPSVTLFSLLMMSCVALQANDTDDIYTDSVLSRKKLTESPTMIQKIKGNDVFVTNHKEILGVGSRSSFQGQGAKGFVIDGAFDPDPLLDVLTTSYLASKPQKGTMMHTVSKITARMDNHSNHVADTISKIVPHAKLHVFDYETAQLKGKGTTSEDTLVEGLQRAIKSKANFINISLRLSSPDDRNAAISMRLLKAFLAVRDAGIVVFKSSGNDSEEIGSTAYTRSLTNLVTLMKGSMYLVGNVTYDDNGRESLSFMSNIPGTAANYVVSAPGTNILANGAIGPMVMSGTSMASATATGMALNIKGEYPNLSNKEIASVMAQSARKKNLGSWFFQNDPLEKEKYGHGVIDLNAALKLAEVEAKKHHLSLKQKIQMTLASDKHVINKTIDVAKEICQPIVSVVKSVGATVGPKVASAINTAIPYVQSAVKRISSWFGY